MQAHQAVNKAHFKKLIRCAAYFNALNNLTTKELLPKAKPPLPAPLTAMVGNKKLTCAKNKKNILHLANAKKNQLTKIF